MIELSGTSSSFGLTNAWTTNGEMGSNSVTKIIQSREESRESNCGQTDTLQYPGFGCGVSSLRLYALSFCHNANINAGTNEPLAYCRPMGAAPAPRAIDRTQSCGSKSFPEALCIKFNSLTIRQSSRIVAYFSNEIDMILKTRTK